MHLAGITFYGIFASGDLQQWAEPTMEEQKAWDPLSAGAMKETSFVRIFIFYLIVLLILKYSRTSQIQ